jgi:hypothetical protein
MELTEILSELITSLTEDFGRFGVMEHIFSVSGICTGTGILDRGDFDKLCKEYILPINFTTKLTTKANIINSI